MTDEFEPENLSNEKSETMSESVLDNENAKKLVQDFMQQYFHKNGNNGNQVLSITQQWDEVDKLIVTALNPQDIENMNPQEKKKYEAGLERKTNVYTGIKKFTGGLINPAQIAAGRYINKANKALTRLQMAEEKFENELYGNSRNGDANFFKSLEEALPKAVIENQNYSTLVNKIQNSARQTQGGIKDQKLHLEQEARMFMGVQEILEHMIGEYDEKIISVKTQVNTLSGIESKDKKTLDNLLNSSGKISSYEKERDMLERAYDLTIEKLDDVEWDLDYIDQSSVVLKVSKEQTRERIRALKSSVRHADNYLKGRKQTTSFSDHMKTMELAGKYATSLGVIGGLGKKVYEEQVKGMGKFRPKDFGSRPSYDGLQGTLNEIKTRRQENAEALRKRLSDKLYKV